MNMRLPLFLVLCLIMTTASVKAQIFINEFLASNDANITDEAGDNEDWIEIYNAGATDINLAGYYISDDITDPLLWQISGDDASLTTVPAGGHLILWADKDTEDGANHVDIKLGAGGEDIILTAPDGLTVVDQLTFGPQSDDVSYGRTSDGAADFQFFPVPTPGAENVSSGGGPTYTVTLNIPIISANDDGEELSGGGVTLGSSDIELGQDGGSPIIGGFRFTNVSLPASATINNAYLQFFADEVQIGPSNLNITGEFVGNAAPFNGNSNLFSSKTATNSSVNWTPAPWPIIGENGANQQSPDLTTIISEIVAHPNWNDGNAMTLMISGTGTRTTYAFDSNPDRVARLIIEAEIPLPTDPIPTVYINEVAANATTYTDASGKREDWIEIYNPNNQDIDLGGLYLTDDFGNLDKWQISPGTILPANNYLVFFADGDPEEGVLHADFSLKAGGEEVALVQLLADGLNIIDSLSYEDMPFLASYGRVSDGATELTFFGEITPDASNNGADLYLPSPSFSVPSGSYASAQSVSITSSIPGAVIYYTTDGSLPDQTATPYNGTPITVNETSSLRAIASLSGYTDSQASDATYLINQNANIPILYITTDPDNFFDDEIGIYVDGTNGVVAYCATEPVNWARDWERPINLKMFLPDGELAFDVDAGAEISGACSRNFAQKSLAINLRDDEYGEETIKYELFPERGDLDDYQRLKLRNSGQDFIRLGFRDMVNQQMLFGKLDIDLQAGRPSLLYINGEFWGIYNIREKYTDEYFDILYGVDNDDIDIIKSPGLPWRDVKQGSDVVYNALYDVVESSNMQVDTDWEYFESQVDVNEMMNYWIAMTYMANYDWPANNLTVWRERSDEGKWRYGVADTDGSTQNMLTPDAEPSFNNFEFINDPNSQSWPNHSNSTLFLRKALDRQSFREEYLQRACSIMELVYNEDRVNQFTDEMVALFEPNVQDQIDRWGFDNAMAGSVSSWEQWIVLYRDFFERRAGFYRQHMDDFYGLDGFYDLTFNYDANTGGDLFVNTNEMDIPFNYQAKYFKNIPLRVKAVAKPGYEFQFWLETGETNPEIDFVSSSNATLTPIFELIDCADIPAGTPCNDNDNCTVNDVYDADCNCAGTFADDDNDGVCDAEDQCPGFDDNLDENNNGIPDDCELNCTDADNDGFCVEVDCNDNNPAIPTTPGTPCDDGNPGTSNDAIQSDGCTCQGEIVPPTGEYCDAQGDQPWLEWIAGVQLNELNNTSGKSPYSDFTSQFATLDAGESYDLTLTAGYSWQTFEEYFSVWIDYNQDNVFNNNELVYSGILTGIPNGTDFGSVTGSVDVPGDALPGTTRMRVAMQREAFAPACGSFPFGEVEDYSVVINESTGANLSINNCPGDINVVADFGAAGAIVNWDALTATSTCDPNTSTINQTNGSPSGSTFAVNTSTTISYTATDLCGNQTTCAFVVFVSAPSSGSINLSCPADISVNADPGQTGATINWSDATGSTTCPLQGLSISQTGGQPSGSFFNIGTYVIEYNASDACDNLATCSFILTVDPPNNGSINLTCPGNISVNADPGQTTAVVNWNDATGSTTCTLQGLSISQTGGQPSGSSFAVGTYVIEYSATDACGNQETCSFVITVDPADNGSIGLACPGDISVTASPGLGGANVDWNDASGSTTCPSQGLSISQTGGQPSGSFFAEGSYQIEYTATDACGNQESCIFNITVLPDNTSGEYCESESDFPWHEWISNVQLNTINNPSGKSNYSDFTDVSTSLTPGATYDINLTTSFSYTTFNEHWKVWIDYNQNGAFEEPGELAYSGVLPAPPNGTDNDLLTGSFSIPEGANLGSTRMRVSMKREADAAPCETLPFGEVEDYTVVIGSNAPQAFSRPTNDDIELYPSPTISKLTIQINKDIEVEAFDIINVSGQSIYKDQGVPYQNTYEVNVTNWLAGMYFVRIHLTDGRIVSKRFIVQRD